MKIEIEESWATKISSFKENIISADRRLPIVPIHIAADKKKTAIISGAIDAENLLAQLEVTPIRAIGVDSEYRYSTPMLKLKSKKYWGDIRSILPLVLSISVWFKGLDDSDEGYIANYVFDIRGPDMPAVLSRLFRLRVVFVFHNIKAELFTLWTLGLDVNLINIYDTYLAAAAIHLGLHHYRAETNNESSSLDNVEMDNKNKTNEKREHLLSLIGQCITYNLVYPFTFEKKEFFRTLFLNWQQDNELTPSMAEYAAADAEFTLRLYVAQQKAITNHGLFSHLYTIEFPFAIANARIEWNGVFVSNEKREKLRIGCQRAVTHYGDILRNFGMANPNSAQQFISLMNKLNLGHIFIYATKGGNQSTSDEVLEQLEHYHPAILAFRNFRKYSRLASEAWLSGIMIGADGRLHPNHRQLGAHTGRNTCSQPSIAGIGKILRPIVTAEPGFGISEHDFNQVEMAVAGAEYGDVNLINDCNSGDIYAASAQRFFFDNLSLEERTMDSYAFKKQRKDLRDRMKPLALAVMYNRQAPSLATELGIPISEAEELINKFLDMYPVLKRALESSSYSGFTKGHAVMVSGLKRHLDKSKTSKNSQWAKNFLRNTPIQGSAAIVFKKAVIDIDRAIKGTKAKIILILHDAVVIECPLSEIKSLSSKVEFIMIHALRSYYPELTGRLDVNNSNPTCWNKDGAADSFDKFLKDPHFQIGS